VAKIRAPNKLDQLFSQYIRMRAIRIVGGCERCLTPKYDIQKDNGKVYPAWKQLQCSHFYGRSCQPTRYDSDNACGLCGACHMYLTSRPEEHRAFFLQRLGQESFDLLAGRMRIMGKADKEALYLYYTWKLKEIEGGNISNCTS
jgi:hypothetical protein